MKHIVSQIHKHNDEFRKYNLPGMIDEFEYSMNIELDFTNEQINMKQLAANFSEDETIHIPIAYSDYCTPKVLTMEFIDGTPCMGYMKVTVKNLTSLFWQKGLLILS